MERQSRSNLVMIKRAFTPATTAFILAVAMVFPGVASAVSTGKPVLQSGPGEPLLARVNLSMGSGEHLADSYLSASDEKNIRPVSYTPESPGKQIDPTLIDKINAEEHALMIEQQKLLVASFLSMQHHLELMQAELNEIKLQLAQTGAGSSTATMPTAPIPSALADEPAISAKQVMAQPDYLQYYAAMALVLAGFALLYFSKKKRHTGSDKQPARPIPKPADDKLTVKQPSQVSNTPAAVIPIKTRNAGNVAPLPSGINSGADKATAEDAMMEEAQLYAANGRVNKAAEILLELTNRCPSKAEAWTFLLSIYSSLSKAAEFENTAREFSKHHKASLSWSRIQVLGRTLAPDNPLYADHNSHISDHLSRDTQYLHHPIGDILIKMGILSKREIQNYLDRFDSKIHGRFGGYLVACKAISIAQLDQALLQQQGVNAGGHPGTLPTLQGVENFLADFDPRLHGSISKFMASRNAATPEQLKQLLKQHSNQATAINPA